MKSGFRMIGSWGATIGIKRDALRDRSVMVVVMIASVKSDGMHLMETVIVMGVRRCGRDYAVIGDGDGEDHDHKVPHELHELRL